MVWKIVLNTRNSTRLVNKYYKKLEDGVYQLHENKSQFDKVDKAPSRRFLKEMIKITL